MLLINGMLFVRKLKKVPAPSFVWKSPSVAPLMQLTFVILLQGVLIIMFLFPSVGLMGGLLVLWNSSIFSGMVVESKQFAHHY